ncbi:t-SNARE [Halteromyces radiatus]|uniref:t-SNARE n=1 Tax=Halteromyces radiatus TaxID=101107 RepID=UPI00221F81B5|nr:t-SNARE [Halteromyces radiatus]KAI8084919.1 t-SNARE [Halteromyces radiatus]
MSFSFSRDRIAELRGDSQPTTGYRRSNDEYNDGFGPRRTPAGYDTTQRTIPATSRYNDSDHQAYEMTSRPQADVSTMPAFFQEIDDLKSEIAAVGNNVQEIQSLHEAALTSTNEAQSKNYASQLNALKKETQQRNNDIKNRIKFIEQSNVKYPNDSDGQIRRTQTNALRKRFMGTIQQYQDMERTYDRRYRQRIERQIRIVKPEATQEEVDDIIDSDKSSQVFTQSLMQAGRTSQARAVLSEVQDRHQDIKKIEQTIMELHQLFMDMSMLVEQQGETLNQVEYHAEDTTANLEQGNKFIARAIQSAKATRAKKWCCFFLTIGICVMIAILVWWFAFGHPGVVGPSSNNNRASSTPAPAATHT